MASDCQVTAGSPFNVCTLRFLFFSIEWWIFQQSGDKEEDLR